MQLLGKDRTLEESLERMKRDLAGWGFELTEQKWKNPVPGIWSVHLVEESSGLYCNGKGATKQAAAASAYGEFIERMGNGYFYANLFSGKGACFLQKQTSGGSSWVFHPSEKWFPAFDQTLSPELLDYYDPEKILRDDPEQALSLLGDLHTEGIDPDGKRGILALPFTPLTQNGGTEISVYFPLTLIWDLYGSNGQSAGNSLLETRVQGLSEVLERHVKFRILREGICLPDIPEELYGSFKNVTAAKEAIESQGFRILIKDASLGGRYPVICIVLIEPDSGRMLLSFGAHPVVEVAVERTMTELLQGRDLDSLPELAAPVVDPEVAADPSNLESHFINSTGAVALDFLDGANVMGDGLCWRFDADGGRQAELEYLIQTIEDEGYAIYERSRQWGSFTAIQLIVPGMSEIYPVEDLSEATRNIYRPLHSLLLDDSLSDQKCLEELDILNTEVLTHFHEPLDLGFNTGIPLPEKSPWVKTDSRELDLLIKRYMLNDETYYQYAEEELLHTDTAGFAVPVFWNSIRSLLAEHSSGAKLLFLPELIKEAKAFLAEGIWPQSSYPRFSQETLPENYRRRLASFERYRSAFSPVSG